MRTYYVVEMGCPSYPVNELFVQNRPFSDPQTQRRCSKVRAASRNEAAELVSEKLTKEREDALDEIAALS